MKRVLATLLAVTVSIGLVGVAPAAAAPVSTVQAASQGGPAVAVPAVSAAAPTSGRQTAFDQSLLALMNKARTSAGIPALQEAPGLVTVAVRWSTAMSNGKTGYKLAHNPSAWDEVAASGASNRTTWGENVAMSSSTSTSQAQSIFDAYMASPGHRANIMNPAFRYVGVGTVTGDRGLWNTQEFTDKVEQTQRVTSVPAATAPLADGDFVRVTGTNEVYRLAGGAPVYVSAWAAVGGSQPVRQLTRAQFDALRDHPADGTFIQAGTEVYRIAGGAPIYVSSWSVFGGAKARVVVDPKAVANAGKSGVWSHLRAVPADGTFLKAGVHVFRVAGGAPIYVSSWTPFGGAKPTVSIDPAAITKAGQSGVWSHLKWYPAENTYLKAGTRVYRVINSRAVYLTSWDLVGGPKPTVTIDPAAITKAGAGGHYDHLAK